MRPKLKIGDSILVKKGAEFAHWGIYLSYENGRVEYRPAQKTYIAYCTFKEIIEARDSVSSKQLK
jgi:hypothetical protein